jgi:ribosomal protein L29
MKIKELKTKSEHELHALLADYRTSVHGLQFKVVSRQLKNLRELREMKKVIARILTLLNKDQNKIG